MEPSIGDLPDSANEGSKAPEPSMPEPAKMVPGSPAVPNSVAVTEAQVIPPPVEAEEVVITDDESTSTDSDGEEIDDEPPKLLLVHEDSQEELDQENNGKSLDHDTQELDEDDSPPDIKDGIAPQRDLKRSGDEIDADVAPAKVIELAPDAPVETVRCEE